MFFLLLLGSLWMLIFGYLGEVLEPEHSIRWGIVSMLGFAVIVGTIMGAGYPKVLQPGTDPAMRKGYLALSVMLPLGWCVYPVGYMTVPGNILEGMIDPNTVTLLYNLADVFNKSGLALGECQLPV
jgi:bacteriorhodopsin